MLVNDNIVDKVEEFKVDVRVDSDHMPLCITIGREENREQEEEGEEEEAVEQTRMVLKWDEEAIQRYMENTEEMQEGEFQEEENVEDMWQKLKIWVKNAMIKKEIKIKKRKLGHKDWWDRSCTKKKREVKSWYRKWRKGRLSRERYVKARKEMKELYVRRQQKKREEEEEKLRRLKKETEVWRYINSRRSEREWKDNSIGKEVWRKHFMKLLEGVENLDNDREEYLNEERGESEGEAELEEEEIRRVVKNMKKKKAAGVDGILMEAWKYAGARVWRKFVELMKRIWKEGAVPTDWKTSIIVPLYKKGGQESVENYRDISVVLGV